MEETVYLEEFI